MTDFTPWEPSGLSLQINMFDKLCALLPRDWVERRLRAELARRAPDTTFLGDF